MRTTEASLGGEQELAAENVASFAIWPHRSLGRGGTALLLGLVAAASAVVVLRCPPAVRWPLAFGGILTVATLAVAFWANNRAARRGETLEIGPERVRVTRPGPRGSSTTREFSTGWVRVSLEHDRHVTNRLVLSESGRRCTIAACLSPAERQTLAEAIRESLAHARSAGGAD